MEWIPDTKSLRDIIRHPWVVPLLIMASLVFALFKAFTGEGTENKAFLTAEIARLREQVAEERSKAAYERYRGDSTQTMNEQQYTLLKHAYDSLLYQCLTNKPIKP